MKGERKPDTVETYMKDRPWLKRGSLEWHAIRCAFAAGVCAGTSGMIQLYRQIEWEQEYKRIYGKKKRKKVKP